MNYIDICMCMVEVRLKTSENSIPITSRDIESHEITSVRL